MSLDTSVIDSRVLMLVKLGKLRMKAIWAAVGGTISERQIDRSLQRLRRKGLIKYGGPGVLGWRTT